MPRDNAERVVMGARSLSPFSGTAHACGAHLRPACRRPGTTPQDLKLEMETLTCDEAVDATRFLSGVVGKAHGRQMSPDARKAWAAELRRSRSKALDAPSWLWTSVVELIAIHERAYRDHCRRYALQTAN
jgi:uncharacterized protein (DUF2252 family)